ncbi:MAG: hypothetical protein ACM3MB_11205 [Acidobacteriota bacterium]
MKRMNKIFGPAAIAFILCMAVAYPASSDVLEGPRGVADTLKPGDGLLSFQFRSRFPKDALAPWFEFKGKLKEAYNINLGFDYTVIGALSTSDLGEGDAIGHDMRFYGTWTPLNPGGLNAGSLTFKVESRKGYTSVPPHDLGSDSGAVAVTAVSFSDAGWVLTNLYWKQRLSGDRLR